MKILVIGNGFLATPIIERLQTEGHDLLVYSRRIRQEIGCQQIRGNVFNFEEFVKTLNWKPQVVIHTAWITTPGVYKSDQSNTDYATFTTKLATELVSSEVEHFIILGTCAEYGSVRTPSLAGTTPLSPLSFYAKQKVSTLHAVKEIMRDSSCRLTWSRVFYPYGPNQDKRRLIPYLFSSLETGVKIDLEDTTSIYDWITARDVAYAISWVIQNNLPVEIDIGTSIGYTNLDLLRTLGELLQLETHLLSSKADQTGINEVFVMDKNSSLLKSGWSPQDTLISGLKWMFDK
jgi:nucleoside-diphosphate-sugar epimerase